MRTWIKRCYEVVVAARPKHVPLSRRELRRRQVLAGRKQPRSAKQRGGYNQDAADKARGGQFGMHQRWHVARGVKAVKCTLCYPQ